MESEPEKISLWLKCLLAWVAWQIHLHSRYLPVRWTGTHSSPWRGASPGKAQCHWLDFFLPNYNLTPSSSPWDRWQTTLTEVWGVLEHFSHTITDNLCVYFHRCQITSIVYGFPRFNSQRIMVSLHHQLWGPSLTVTPLHIVHADGKAVRTTPVLQVSRCVIILCCWSQSQA